MQSGRVLPSRKLIQTLTLAFLSSFYLFLHFLILNLRGKDRETDPERTGASSGPKTHQHPPVEVGESSGLSLQFTPMEAEPDYLFRLPEGQMGPI